MTRTISLAGFTILLACLSLFNPRLNAATTLLSYNSGWRYFDYGYEPSPSWALREYDDTDWSWGFGQFGYGDGDESTTVSYGSDDEHKYVTTYFRTHISI